MIRPGLALFPAAALLALAHPLAAGVGPAGQAFVPITRVPAVDTRGPAAPNGGPALAATRCGSFPITGTCGVPANALGLVVNLTVVDPAALGYAQLFAGDAPAPPTTVLNFKAHGTRAGLAFVALAANGSGTVALANGSTGSADYLLDVEGYFVLACTSADHRHEPRHDRRRRQCSVQPDVHVLGRRRREHLHDGLAAAGRPDARRERDALRHAHAARHLPDHRDRDRRRTAARAPGRRTRS